MRGQVVDVLLRERRALASAQAFFRRARATAEAQPAAIVTDHHQPYVRAAQQNLPLPWSPGSRAEQGRLTIDPRSVIAP